MESRGVKSLFAGAVFDFRVPPLPPPGVAR
jgi:hypothetical protein